MCKINQEELFQGPCTLDQQYGFKDGRPCILIKLNKIYKWEPEPFLSEDEMPEDIPASIKSAFRDNVANGKPELVKRKIFRVGGTKNILLYREIFTGVSHPNYLTEHQIK